ncbi:ubiquinone/menaquinone biosynthesis C-methylase UbiE [Sagittula marina]|uniref:Ubiquinone/menaquinone biosynthesis C-methylase UbiE n=1 Tax=Sagittula marina TaxID=943940 RepID=A0A7W6DS57_9RHOB|nr:class I SAM-dependent methyltransferase [Sagittula marina]MBB3985093.1 ubiquinone/menaquinone biosynthesis C-methylase UbiE [Sagittula marina]
MQPLDWNAKFDRPDYLYGTAPVAFLSDNAGMIPPAAKTLSVAEGEGRNAVFLAERGCEVTAFDGASNALEKAARLASDRGVTLQLHEADIAAWDWQPETYDLVVAIHWQFTPPALRDQVFAGMKRTLKPGGRLMLSGFSVTQLKFSSGGPRHPDHLYTPELLTNAFADMHILRCAEYEKQLSSGAGHTGRSALVDLIADKLR